MRLAIIEDRLNTMPRKLHDWHSAHSVYTALCRNDRLLWAVGAWRVAGSRGVSRDRVVSKGWR